MSYDKTSLTIFECAMELAAENGWNHFDFQQISEKTEIPLYVIHQHFPCKAHLLLYLNQLADRAALEQVYQENQPTAEYLFDLFMERFDTLQHYRAGFIAALQKLPFHPATAIMMTVAAQNSMRCIAEAAHINTNGLRGIACIKGLNTIWTLNLRVWMKDESDDLSQTMASLDKTIKNAGKFSPYFVVKNPKETQENQDDTQDEPYVNEEKH